MPKPGVERINRAMKGCHLALHDRGSFTAQEAWRIIRETTGCPVETAKELFGIMRLFPGRQG